MPEVAELKLSADLILPLIQNKKLINVFPSTNGRYADQKPKGFSDFIKYLQTNNCLVLNVQTKGKFMYWTFSNDWFLFCTFGMTGQFSPKEGKHPSFCFEFDSQTLYFNDPRHFGTIQFVHGKQHLTKKLNQLGWDPLKHGMDKKWINNVTNICSKNSKPIGQLLLDQGVFAGVGNYIRAEALYIAQISPWRTSSLLSKDEVKSLCQAVVNVANDAYNHQGATIKTYQTPFGEEGKYSTIFKIYGKKLDPLGNTVKTETTPEGRTIHWCPTIQN